MRAPVSQVSRKPSGGRKSKAKGDRREREAVALLRGIGVPAERVPLSGASGGQFGGDIRAELPGVPGGKVEVKGRGKAEGWKSVKKWLGSNDLLMLIEDRQDPLAVLPWAVFEKLVETARGDDPAVV